MLFFVTLLDGEPLLKVKKNSVFRQPQQTTGPPPKKPLKWALCGPKKSYF